MISLKGAKKRQKQIEGMRERGYSLRQIGKIVGLTGERVRQLLESGIKVSKCIVCGKEIYGKSICNECPRSTSSSTSTKLKGREFTREKVRERDNHTCQKCGKKWKKGQRKLDVHHLNGDCGNLSRAYDKKQDMEKMITLCHKCHLNLDEVRRKMSEGKE